MNIVPSYPNIVPLALQPAVEAARRDTQKRELVPAPVQAETYAKESQIGSEKDKARSQDNRPVAYQADGSLRQSTPQQYVTAVDDQEQRKQRERGQQQAGDGQADKKGGSGDQTERQQQNSEKAVEALKQRDQTVRAHEQAHQVTGGRYASRPDFTMDQGPDGRQYAIGGQVKIDISPESTPDATIRKMQQVQSAALAPIEPSSQDRAVAAKAARIASEARAELDSQSRSQNSTSPSDGSLLLTGDPNASTSESSVSRSGTLSRNNQDELMVRRNQVIANRYDMAWNAPQASKISRYA